MVGAAPSVGWGTVQTYVDACAAAGADVAELTCTNITTALDLLGGTEAPDAALLVDLQRWDDEGKTVVQLDDYRFDLARSDMTDAERGGLVAAMGEIFAHVREEEEHAAGVKHITLEAPPRAQRLRR